MKKGLVMGLLFSIQFLYPMKKTPRLSATITKIRNNIPATWGIDIVGSPVGLIKPSEEKVVNIRLDFSRETHASMRIMNVKTKEPILLLLLKYASRSQRFYATLFQNEHGERRRLIKEYFKIDTSINFEAGIQLDLEGNNLLATKMEFFAIQQ